MKKSIIDTKIQNCKSQIQSIKEELTEIKSKPFSPIQTKNIKRLNAELSIYIKSQNFYEGLLKKGKYEKD